MNDELYHYGIRGMKWGVRRYQNSDGSLTSEGKKRYGYSGFSSGRSKTALELDLNQLDRARVQYKNDMVSAEKRIARSNRSKQKEKFLADRQRAEKNMRHAEKMINGLLKAAEKNHVKVDSKEVTRYGDRVSRSIINSLISGAFELPVLLIPGMSPTVAAGLLGADLGTYLALEQATNYSNGPYKGKEYRVR